MLTSGSNFAAGSTTLSCSGSTPPVGQPAYLSQCDTGMSGAACTTGTEADNGSIWECGRQNACSNQSASGGHINESQTVLITAVSGSCSSSCNVTISPGIYMPDFAYATSPRLTWYDATYTSIGTGFENLTVDFSSGTSSNYGSFAMQQAYASWIKGVRFVGANQGSCCAILLDSLGNSLFANNYLFTSNPITQSGAGLPVQWGTHSAVLNAQQHLAIWRRHQHARRGRQQQRATSSRTTTPGIASMARFTTETPNTQARLISSCAKATSSASPMMTPPGVRTTSRPSSVTFTPATIRRISG